MQKQLVQSVDISILVRRKPQLNPNPWSETTQKMASMHYLNGVFEDFNHFFNFTARAWFQSTLAWTCGGHNPYTILRASTLCLKLLKSIHNTAMEGVSLFYVDYTLSLLKRYRNLKVVNKQLVQYIYDI